MHKIELLAPAGNFDCLIAAVQNGADAVYLSGKSFGARSYADNFDRDELERATDYCHLRGVDVHVTVNTLLSDSEISEVQDYLLFLNKIGVDAIIVQDIGVAELARKLVPDLAVHASTQMTVHNSDGVNALKELGMKRAVLSREISIDNIKKIVKNTDMEIEVFAHGALCMSYSGQCLMSSIIGGRSGNRGKCAQPCRLKYSVNHGTKKAFYMSLKDLSVLEHLGELADAGVSSLKIEGRMKGNAYVAAVVSIYRKYLDFPQKINPEDMELLDKIFNRGGLTDGYVTGKTGKNMFAFDKPDNPYRKNEDEFIKEVCKKSKTENRKTELTCRIDISEGEFPQVVIESGKCQVEYIYDKRAQSAVKAPLTEDTVLMQFNKTGGTPFEFKKMDIDISGNAFLSAGDLNSIRRNALKKLECAIINSYKRDTHMNAWENKANDNIAEAKHSGFVCEVTCFNQLEALIDMPFELFYVPLHIIEWHIDEASYIKNKTVIVMPAILHENEFDDCCKRAERLLNAGFCGVTATNISLINRFPSVDIYGGYRLNVFNSNSLMWWKNHGVKVAELSPELTIRQLKEIKKSIPVQVMAYGRLPLMISENCVIRNGSNCPCNGNNSITDRMGMTFPVINDGDSCRSVVLNCNKTFTAFDMQKLKEAGISFFRLYFTDESAAECRKICDTYLNSGNYRPDNFTGAHFYKGVM